MYGLIGVVKNCILFGGCCGNELFILFLKFFNILDYYLIVDDV